VPCRSRQAGEVEEAQLPASTESHEQDDENVQRTSSGASTSLLSIVAGQRDRFRSR
jgi:hypothetical protein